MRGKSHIQVFLETLESTLPPIRIAIIGKQRTGKDTLAQYLQHRYGFKRVALADKIYSLARELFDMREKDRQLLINIGENLRQIDELVWCKYVMNIYADERLLVISDVRMKHEYEYLKKHGFIFIKLHSSDEVRTKREGYNPEAENDRTENEVEKLPADYVVLNNSSLTMFFLDSEQVIESIIEKRKEEV